MIWVKVILHLSDIPAADEFRKKRLLRLTELFHIRSTWLGSVSDKNWYQSGGQSIGPTSKVGGSKKWLWLGARWLMIVTVKNKTIFDTKVGILYHNSNMNLSKFELILLALLILIVERYFPIHFALSSYINFCSFCTLLRPPLPHIKWNLKFSDRPSLIGGPTIRNFWKWRISNALVKKWYWKLRGPWEGRSLDI